MQSLSTGAGLTNSMWTRVRSLKRHGDALRRRQQWAVVAAVVFGLVAMVAVFAGWQARSATQEAFVQRQRATEQTQEATSLRETLHRAGAAGVVQGHAMRAVVYLNEAYQQNETGASFLFLLKQAMHTLDAQHAILRVIKDPCRPWCSVPMGSAWPLPVRIGRHGYGRPPAGSSWPRWGVILRVCEPWRLVPTGSAW